jgi:ACR3 family arsenite transporter
MSAQCEVAMKQAASAPMSVFERYLTVWVFLCIVTGIALGQMLPGVFRPSAAWRWRRSICRSVC